MEDKYNSESIEKLESKIITLQTVELEFEEYKENCPSFLLRLNDWHECDLTKKQCFEQTCTPFHFAKQMLKDIQYLLNKIDGE